MATSGTVVRVVLLTGVALALAAAVKIALEKREVAIATVDDIEGQLDALDPVTRAAVVTRLSKDAADQARSSVKAR